MDPLNEKEVESVQSELVTLKLEQTPVPESVAVKTEEQTQPTNPERDVKEIGKVEEVSVSAPEEEECLYDSGEEEEAIKVVEGQEESSDPDYTPIREEDGDEENDEEEFDEEEGDEADDEGDEKEHDS